MHRDVTIYFFFYAFSELFRFTKVFSKMNLLEKPEKKKDNNKQENFGNRNSE